MSGAMRFWVRYPWAGSWCESSCSMPVPKIKYSDRRLGWFRFGIEIGRFGIGAGMTLAER